MAAAKKSPSFVVLKDTREQAGWDFPPDGRRTGTFPATLKTGDYTLAGFEDEFVIERKGSAGEFAANLFQDRFHRELGRLDAFPHPYLFLEFDAAALLDFPVGSGIPRWKWSGLKVSARLVQAKFHEMQFAHPNLRVWFVGGRGAEVAASLFRRVADLRA